MKRKLLTLLLTVCLILTFIPIAVAAENPPVPIVSGNNICANGAPIIIVAGRTTDYTNILYDKDNDGIIEDTEYLNITGTATIDGYNLSNHTIYGGALSGNITADSMITIEGGKVGSVYGANKSYANMPGGVTIVMNGGSVARILACGYNNNIGGEGKTVSVAIHGGTVRGGVDQSINLESRNYASITSLLIDGGTINGQISVKNTGSFIIKGGNIPASIKSGGTINSSPTDGMDFVYKTALTLKENGTAKTDTAVSALTTDDGYTYGMTDVKTDADGKLYIYLPESTTVTGVTVGDDSYTGSVTTTTDGTASGDLMKAVSTPPEATEATVTKTAEIQSSVSFTLTTAPVGTYKVYADNTATTVHDTVSAALNGMSLTLTDSGADIAAGDYYVSVTETGKGESTRLKLTVNNMPPCIHEGGIATCHTLAVCTICGKEYGSLAPDNHAGATEPHNVLAADCENEGYSGDTYCLGCNKQIQTGTVTLPLNHDFTEAVIDTEHCKTTATCTSPAVYYYDCSRCDEISTTETFEYGTALGHSYSSEWTIDIAPTTTSVGSKSHHCTVCGDKADITEIPMEPEIIKGDVSGDGRINALDLIRFKLCLNGTITLTETQFSACDINGDTRVNALDIIRLKLFLNGKILSL